MRVAWIGVGTMGLPMARHLVAAGHDVVACDLEPARASELGAAVAESPAEAAAGADVAILSLPSPAAVEQAALGPGGAAEGLSPGAVLVDMSTSPPALARRLAGSLEPAEIQALDAPVSGGPVGAEAGTLAIMVGGSAAAFERCLPFFEAMGSRVERVGEHGAGQAVKLCNNMIVACAMAAIGESCRLLEREGIDPAQAYECFTSSTSDSSVMRRRFPVPGVRPEHPASREYTPLFRLDLLVKDLGLALELAAEHGVAMPIAEAAAGTYRDALDAGLAALDYSAVYRVQGQ
jgi:3-hydroxyisobutyrate dehydrogenase-like beta-hydroxyacid dehydrogenase